jgi:seryl-tRNA synthetase
MLDIQYIRDNPDLVQKIAEQKGAHVDVQQLLGFDQKRRELIQQSDQLRAKRNDLAESTKGQKPSDEQIEQGRLLKEQSGDIDHKLASVSKQYEELLKTIPNIPSADTPVGDSEDHNQILRTWGDKPQFDFQPKPHWEMTQFINQERAGMVSGARFAYLQKGLVRLQFALNLYGMDVLTDEEKLREIASANQLDVSTKPFELMAPPMMMRTEPYEKTARLKPDEVTFKLANDDLWLIGSAEHSLAAYFMGETLDSDQFPIRFVGHSTSFRREVGSAGKDTRGILRTHHFDKLEMESFNLPDKSEAEHKFMIAIQEYIMQQLKLPYQVVLKCTFDMGGPNARGVDIETWMAGQNAYRETHSADWLTDYQARGLNTKVATDSSKLFVHTNDATAVTTRVLIAILENYQTVNGGVIIPDVLRKYMNNQEQIN